MSSAPSTPVLPFAELLDELRRHGFVIGLDQHLRMQQLLDHLAGECPPERLKTHLAPIFATSREEQERFHRIFDRIYPVFAEVEREEQERNSGHVAAPPVAVVAAKPEQRLWIIGALVLLIAVLVIGWWKWLKPSPPLPAPVTQVTVAPNPTPLAIRGGDSLAPLDSVSIPPPPPTPERRLSPIQEPTAGFLDRHRTGTRVLLIVLAIGGFLLNEWRLYQRRRLVVGRERREKPPFTWPVRLESPANPYAQSADLPNAARLLRQREAGALARLSVEETVTATIAALGFPTFRYRSDTRAPDYLLLIERAAHRDHAARLYQALGRSLEREGVHVTRYLHDGDPRVCYSENGEQRELLVDLRRRFPDYRVLLFSKGEKLVDQVTGRLQPWTTQFLSWSDRAILTPESPAAWGLREVALAQHFVVLPATTAGLMGVVGHFRGPARPDASRWRALDQDPTVPRLDEGDPLPALQTYLGPRVYRWLCACAVYPELHWDLTLHFGGLSIFGPGLISEENLLRLLRLPWFRQGAIPDEIRARLIDQLTEAEERAVREAIVELLERNPAPGDSVSANRYELDLVVQRLALHRRDPKQRRAAMRDLAGFPRRELVQDFAMLKLIEEMPSSRLQVLLPRRLRRVFYRGGVPVLGVRSGIRAAALAGVIGASLFFTRRGTVESQQDMVIFLQGTYGSPTLVVGEQTNVLAFRRLPDSVARNGFNLSTFPDEFTDWSVDRPDILTVDRLGEVVALKPGEAVVTVFSAGHQSRLRVRVEPAELAINRDSVELSPGDVRALKLLVPSQDRELISRGHEGVSWSVSDSTLVRVAPDGVIEALRPGRATVTVNAIRRRARVAVTIGGEPVNQPRIAGDARRAIDQVVQEYTRAAAAGDIDRMVSLYPSLPKVVRAGYDRLGAARGGIRTKDWKIESAAISQDSARLKMSGSLDLFDDRREVIWQADLEGITLARRDDRWLITGIQTVRQSKNLPPEALAYFSRARMFYEQGNRDRARLFAERALAAYPVYTEAESLLEQLNSGGETTWTEAGSTALTRLDSLRLRAVTGRRTARKEYFAAFDSVLLRPTQDLIRRQLLALPSRPEAGADYVRSYNLLKAHLITTGFPLQSSPDFLAPVLTQVWGEAAHPSAYLLRLAATQFAFYAGELPQDKSLVFGASDTLAIQRARSFLRQFNGGEQVYSMMLSEAARSGAQPFAFPRLFPSAGQVLVVPHVVPAGFTRQGWAYMEGTVFKHSDRYFQGVDGVLGGEGPDEREHQDLLNSIRSRYRRDYEEQWRQVLAQTRLVPYANLADASRKLRILAGNPSPLLQLINAVSLNTAMDSGFASTVFQPARVVSPADSTRLTGPLTGPYLKAIAGLGTALEALVAAEPEARKGPGDEAKAQLVAAKTAAQALQLSFTAVPGGVGSDINRLLTSVFGSLDSTPGQIGTPGADRGQTPEAASVVLGAGVNSLQVGQTVTLVALARDAKGKALADRTLVWKSRNPLVASVTADGKVTALVDGTAEIVVEVDGISASQRVTVTPGGQDSTARITVGDSNVSGRARNIPPEALSAYSRALLYQDQDSLQKASDYFRDALRIYPDYREAHEGLTRVVVRERLNDWTKHLEGRSLAGLLQLYPDMPQKDQLAWKRLLENPSVTRIAAVPQGVSVELTGQVEARVRYTLAYSMTVRPSGVQTSVSRYEATFKLVRGAWIITSMQGQP